MKVNIANVIIFVLITATNLQAMTFFVASNGNDKADGSTNAPWLTLQHGADNLKAGDTLIVRKGVYKGFSMGWDSQVNGTKKNPIVVKAESGAEINDVNSRTADGINLEGASYIIIDGFTINNTKGTITRAGIRAVTDTGVIIRNNTIDSCGTWGILTGFSESVTIENNSTSRSVQQHGIYFSNSADNPVIRGNRVFGNNMCGIHMNGDASMGGDGIISNALVENNIIWNNGKSGGSAINCDGVQKSLIRNNLLYNNHASGISLYQIDASEAAKDNIIINNTIIEASDARWCINIKGGSTGNTVMNCILFNYHATHGSISIDQASLSGFKSDYNSVMNRLSPDDDNTIMKLSQWQSATGQDNHSINADPAELFVNVSGNDYHLKPGCSAIDKGTSVNAPSKDIAGVNRPDGNGYDIGAYEFSSSGVFYHQKKIGNIKNSEGLKADSKIIKVNLAGRVIKDKPHCKFYPILTKAITN
jgi:parallel beta-helix repeat protein